MTRDEKDFPWNDLDKVDFGQLDKSPWDQIPNRVFEPIEKSTKSEFVLPYTPKQIKAAFQKDRIEGEVMKLINRSAREAQMRATGEIKYEPKFNEDGWTATIQMPEGIVGLASLARVQLVMPKKIELSDTAVGAILEVEKGKPIPVYYAIPVSSLSEKDDWLKRLKKTEAAKIKAGIIVEDNTPEPGKCTIYALGYQDVIPAKFMSQKFPDGGRVWIDTKQGHHNFHSFPLLTEHGELQKFEYEDETESLYQHLITSYDFHFNKYTPDGAQVDRDHLRLFRERFIKLAAIAALRLGQPQRLTIKSSGANIFPQDLHNEGYFLEWLKGKSGEWKERQGYHGGTLIRARKGDKTIFLESDSLYTSPWEATISQKIPPLNSAGELEEFFRESLIF